MAPYAGDGRWYHAKIVKLDGPKCRVCYTEYDEEDEVQVSQLLKYVSFFKRQTCSTNLCLLLNLQKFICDLKFLDFEI